MNTSYTYWENIGTGEVFKMPPKFWTAAYNWIPVDEQTYLNYCESKGINP